MQNDDRTTISPEVQGKGSSDGNGSVGLPESVGPSCHQESGFTGFLKMAACCAGPILLLGALPYFGSALGVTGASLLSTLALLACPAGMGFMMWRMSRQRAIAAAQAHPPELGEANLSRGQEEART